MTNETTPDLTTWLRTQLDDDERVAREAASSPAGASWTAGTDGLAMPYIAGAKSDDGQWLRSVAQPEEIEYGPHIARWDPARVLAEVDAKRSIIGLHVPVDGVCSTCRAHASPARYPARYPCDTLRLLAQPYAGRPGWQEEWRT